MAVAVAVAVAVSGGGAVAVAVAVAGLTKRFFNHIQKDFLINVWCYRYPRPSSQSPASLAASASNGTAIPPAEIQVSCFLCHICVK